MRGVFRFSGLPCSSARLLLQDGVDHLHHETLLGFGQLRDAFELLLEFGRGAALGSLRFFADQFFHGDAQGARQRRQQRDRYATASDFVGSHHLLRQAQRVGELLLGQVAVDAQRAYFADRDRPFRSIVTGC